eukprot:GHVR01004414.1.p1 GENE.GHVR01004414.1~~GHVR01004414.1.p1  ORF type:complete len:164 (+),score=43.71 GHVR01004414.1:99-590(+)
MYELPLNGRPPMNKSSSKKIPIIIAVVVATAVIGAISGYVYYNRDTIFADNTPNKNKEVKAIPASDPKNSDAVKPVEEVKPVAVNKKLITPKLFTDMCTNIKEKKEYSLNTSILDKSNNNTGIDHYDPYGVSTSDGFGLLFERNKKKKTKDPVKKKKKKKHKD